MLLPNDDYPIHQTPLPLAHTMGGHPNAYDRFWFNAVSDSLVIAVALGLYPNRGVIDGAISVVENGVQHSVFASDALIGRPTAVGPIRIEIVEPFRVNRIVIDAAEHGVVGELTYEAATATIEEPRQTMFDGERIFMDVTRATQLGTWSGWVETPTGRHDIDGLPGTKDRSWGIRPVGEPLPGAPSQRAPQIAFTWAPLLTERGGVHVMHFDDANGRHLHHSAGVMPRNAEARHVTGDLEIEWQPGTRWLARASAFVENERYELEPVARFHMRGAGYSHPTFAHGRWHGGAQVASETLILADLDPLDYHNVHVQHIVRVSGADTGWGVVEQLIIGPYAPAGTVGLLDGSPGA